VHWKQIDFKPRQQRKIVKCKSNVSSFCKAIRCFTAKYLFDAMWAAPSPAKCSTFARHIVG
jgi:hypothetical protein